MIPLMSSSWISVTARWISFRLQCSKFWRNFRHFNGNQNWVIYPQLWVKRSSVKMRFTPSLKNSIGEVSEKLVVSKDVALDRHCAIKIVARASFCHPTPQLEPLMWSSIVDDFSHSENNGIVEFILKQQTMQHFFFIRMFQHEQQTLQHLANGVCVKSNL